MVLLQLLICPELTAQKQGNIWYFGRNAGVSFNSGAPVALTDGVINQSEGCASIADENGQLLFYTDGSQVWNRNHAVMPNGSGLRGQNISAQSAIVVPMPQNKNLYYVFTIGDWTNTSAGYGLNYSVVDMSRNNGLGDVTIKNSLLFENAREQVTAVHHSNCQDVWIITHEKGNNNRFHAFLLTAAGITPTAVTSAVGMTYHGGNRYGYLKASHDGKKLCSTLGYANTPTTSPTVELYDFDNLTGQVSNAVTLALHNAIRDAYASEFSPDNTKLYVVAFSGSFIYQYDVSLGSAAAILASRQSVGTGTSIKACVQLGPDKKIYVSRSANGYLGVINNPNNAGALCNYVDNGVYLGGRNGALGLPNFNALYFSYPDLGPDSTLCIGNTLPLDVSGLGSTSYLWQDGSTSPAFTVTQPGWHWVEVTSTSGCRKRDSVNIQYTSLQVSLGNDTVLCDGNNLLLDLASVSADSYLWQDGTTGSSYTVSLPGTYSVQVKKGGCNATDNILVSTGVSPTPDLGKDTAICNGASLQLDATAAGIQTYTWQDGSIQPTFTINQTGQYWVEVADPAGCRKRDTINVSYTNLSLELGNDTTLCNGSYLLLNAASSAGDSYLWQDGTLQPSYTITQPGKYWVEINKSNCTTADTINVVYSFVPTFSLGNDTTICNGTALPLNVLVTGSHQYTWQDGSAGNTYTVSQPGQYWVQVANNGCVRADTIQVSLKALPTVELGRDTALCDGASIILNASVAMPASWQWQDGAVMPTYNVTRSGKYRVEVASTCGIVADSVLVQFYNCDCQIKLPNAFTPDGNGRNDQFKPVMEAGCRFSEYRLTIFNRWGEKVFESTNPATGWNGLYKYERAMAGGYAYMLQYRTPDRNVVEKRSGVVMLLR
ncbi:gliding motility-associated C-terminal domain-containing protein [Longitalea luteola]|uniref:T9SS type B sorting domain-containing protein n=1 Tax=Longitalea luteola TaxID=2812563 RepID=UPI001A95832C|nr:gliding motility-associated C-terminal domain-containing protein [Longitalea luteola]